MRPVVSPRGQTGDRLHRWLQLLSRGGSGRPELKWLNFLPLCERLLRGHHLAAINYYTARVVDRPEDPRQSQRQDSYRRVLENAERVNVVYGQFQKNP